MPPFTLDKLPLSLYSSGIVDNSVIFFEEEQNGWLKYDASNLWEVFLTYPDIGEKEG